MNNDARLKSLVGSILGIDPGGVNDDLRSVETDTWDSLNHINLVTAIEQEFGISFPTDSIDQIKSVGSLKQHLSDLGVVFDG